MSFYPAKGGGSLKSETVSLSANFGNDGIRSATRTFDTGKRIIAAGIVSHSRSTNAGTSNTKVSFDGSVITVIFSRAGSNTDVNGSITATVQYFY